MNTESDMRVVERSVEKPVISVLCTCYNHRRFIEEALFGFLMQETSFSFEIIVNDDASTDGSLNVLRDYESRYPHLITVIENAKNQYSQDKRLPLLNCLRAAKGKYLAICEGDDVWLDSSKLELQMAALKRFPRAGMVVNPGYIGTSIKSTLNVHCWHGAEEILFTNPCCVLDERGQFAPTASYLVKREVMEFLEYESFRNMPIIDLFIELYSIRAGGMLYVPHMLTFYRTGFDGSFSSGFGDDSGKKIKLLIRQFNKIIRSDPFLSELDWNKKKAIWYLSIGVAHLKRKEYRRFLTYLKLSQRYRHLGGLRFSAFYTLARVPPLLRWVLLVTKK